MPPSRGLSDPPSNTRGGLIGAIAVGLQVRQAARRRHALGFALFGLPLALSAVHARPAQAQTTVVGDRYSGDVYVQPAYRQAMGPGGPTLSWPGKTEATAPQPPAPSAAAPAPGFDQRWGAPAYAAQAYRPAYQPPINQQVAQNPAYQHPAYPNPAYAPSAYRTQAYPTPAYQPPSYQAPGLQPAAAYPAQVARAPTQQARTYAAPPTMPWYQRYGPVEASSAPSTGAPPPAQPQAGPPQSIYDPPAAQGGAATGPSPAASPAAALTPPRAAAPNATPTATAANDGETAHFYSLHRQYGLTPDPDPIPPQFFTQTADLSDPPGPNPVYKAANGTGGATTAVHNVQPDDSTSTLGQP